MIGWLKGEVLALEKDEVLIKSSGVGYWVTLGAATRAQMGLEKGKEAEFYISTSVKEDDIKLFGFDDLERRKLFLSLLSVNGVGPKAGVALLDQLSPGEIVVSIQNGDYKTFTKVSGIGTKTAQRIVVDLAGKVDDFHIDQQSFAQPKTSFLSQNQRVAVDARSALLNLGIPEKEADKVIQNHLKPDMTIDDLLRLCLKDLQK